MTDKALATVRRFRTKDIRALLEIEGDSFPKSAYPKEVLLKYASRFPDTFLVLETENGIGGYIIYDLEGHIYSMAVRSSARRKGFGTILFRTAAEQVQDSVWLEVRSKNRGAIDFYHKMGMRVGGKVDEYYDEDDAIIMVFDPDRPAHLS